MFRRSLTSLFSTFLFEAPAAPTAPAAPVAPPAVPPVTPPAPEPTAPPAVPPVTPPAPEPTETVPYDRFKTVNDELQATKALLTEQQRKDLPEIERARAEAADATARAEAAELERDQIRIAAETTEREGWVRKAATDAGFHNPEDAVLRVKTSDVTTEAKAKAAVETLAKDETLKHLVKGEPPPAGGADLLTQILNRGKPGGEEEGKTTAVVDADTLNKMTVDQLAELQERDPELYERSLRAASAADQQ